MTPASLTRFGSSWDGALTATTIVSVLVCALGAVAAFYIAFLVEKPVTKILPIVLGTVSLMVPLAVMAFAPKALEVGPGTLRVLRPAGAVEFRLSGEARVISAGELRGSVRTFGVGGMFGWFGQFRAPSLGSYRLFSTRRAGYVLAPTAEGPVVVTPDRPEEAVVLLNRSSPGR